MRLPANDTFTVVLIGGSAGLVGGGEIDTRREYRGDPLCKVTHAAAANSLYWWETAASLVLPIIESDDHLKQATVFGKRTVLLSTASGESKRRRLSSVLEGEVAAVKEATVAQPFSDADWLLSEYALHSKRRLNPDLRCQLFVSTEDSMFSVDYDSQPLFETFEQFAESGSVLIVPHTHLVERFLNAYSAWVNLAREPDISEFLTAEGDIDLAKDAPPIATNATFEVTGIFTSAGWQNSTALEAARHLKKTRFDLNLGIWDLVNDEALRTSLLDQQSLERARADIADLPTEYELRAKEAVEAVRKAKDGEETDREQQLLSIAQILQDDGWTQSEHRDNAFMFPLATVPNAPQPLLRFDLYVNKGSAAMYLASEDEEIIDVIAATVNEAQPALSVIYDESEFDESAGGIQVWRISKLSQLVDLADRAVELRPIWQHELRFAIAEAKKVEATVADLSDQIRSRANGLKEDINSKLSGDSDMADVVVVGLADATPDVREQSLTLLETLADSELSVFQVFAIEDPDEMVRQTATRRLSRDEVSIASSAQVLLEVATSDPSARVRSEAVNCYLERIPPEFTSVIAAGLEDPDPDVVASTLGTLRWANPISDFAPRASTLTEHSEENVRSSAAHVVAHLSPDSCGADLKRLARDPSARVREAALEALTAVAANNRNESRDASPEPQQAEKKVPASEYLTEVIQQFTEVGEETKNRLAEVSPINDPASANNACRILNTGAADLENLRAALARNMRPLQEVEAPDTNQAKLIEMLGTIESKLDATISNYRDESAKCEQLVIRAGSQTPPPPPPPGARPNRTGHLPPPPTPKSG